MRYCLWKLFEDPDSSTPAKVKRFHDCKNIELTKFNVGPCHRGYNFPYHLYLYVNSLYDSTVSRRSSGNLFTLVASLESNTLQE